MQKHTGNSPYVNAYAAARRNTASPARKAWMLAGWGVFLLSAVLLFVLLAGNRSGAAAQKARFGQAKADMQAEQAAALRAQADKLAAAGAEAQRLEALAAPLEEEVKSAADENDKRDQKAEELSAAIASASAEGAPAETAGADAAAAGGAAELPTPELAAQVAALEKEKKALSASYASTFRNLEATLSALLQKGEPVPLQKFYLQHIRSPFAPAALHGAAEAWYKRGDLARARTNYEVLMATFPDSEYCRECEGRVEQIARKVAYTPPVRTAMIPYKPFSVPN